MAGERLEQQHEGQEHAFLVYEDATIYFTYTFSWDLGKLTFRGLDADLRKQGWVSRLLHERALWPSTGVAPAYQPNLVTRSCVLESSEDIGRVAIIVPMATYRGIALGKTEAISVDMSYTVRVFDNGGGTCTFAVRIPPDQLNEPSAFKRIHQVLHLAHNVDHGQDDTWEHVHLTNTYISTRRSRGRKKHRLFPRTKRDSHTYPAGYCSLHDLFRRFVRTAPWNRNVDERGTDGEVLLMGDLRQDFQTPFVFTVARIERNSFLRFRKTPTMDVAKEVASLLCKLTMDNRYIDTDFLHMSEDYVTRVLPYNMERGGLLNLCLDRRLFFMFSRRGAIALTSSLGDVPSAFVIPSLLNLCELLRARWYLANIVNIRLDRAISDACSGERTGAEILGDIFHWRGLFAHFYRDPVPFLFDGGSITELAEIAERELWLAKLSEETARKFSVLDRIVQDLYERKDVRGLLEWDSQMPR